MASDSNAGGNAPPGEPTGHPHPVFNWMSVIGGGITAAAVTAGLFFFVMGLVSHDGGAYAGLLLVPPLLFAAAGFVFFVIGWLREIRRQRRGAHSSFFGRYVIDPWSLIRTVGPGLMLGLVALGTVILLSAGAGSLAVVELSESNTFCGQACHSVMKPESVAYDHGPHSRVDCVKCHVAPGAGGFLAAKIGGLRQLWGVTVGHVTRPIPTPIRSPISRERCESCHSAERNVGYTAMAHDYFVNGSEDTPVQLGMVVKVGGGSDGLMEGAGIHYHMLVAERVEFAALDPQRQQIAWVRVTDRDGSVREFSSEAHPLSEEERADLPVHRMQCIDCHSRPAHAFPSPVESVNRAFQSGKLPDDVPFLKSASVQALDGDYETTEEAMAGIATALESFYEEEDPDVLEDQAEELADAANVLRQIYARSIFPEMKASWRAHPDNSGHLESPGCFRCHNDEMVDEDGTAVFADCSGCHAILAQDDDAIGAMAEFGSGRHFVHPEDGSIFEEFSLCSDCHTGGKEIYE